MQAKAEFEVSQMMAARIRLRIAVASSVAKERSGLHSS
jgi:hypothetical protein